MLLEPPLETDRLLIREWCEGDWRAAHAYASMPEVVRYMPWGPNSEEETRNFVRQAIAAQAGDPRWDFELAVTLRSGMLVGGCGVSVTNATHREGTIGYCFHPDYWGRGYATEAAGALLDFGFDVLALHRIWATCDVENTVSARVLEKVGMRREGVLREHLMIHGEWRDSLLYAILDRERRARTGAGGQETKR